MHTKLVVPVVSVVSSLLLVGPALGQIAGQVPFDITESALAGTVSCNGGAATPIAPVAPSTTDVSGSNEDQASHLSQTACGLPLYSIASVDDSSSASDTASLDDAQGKSTLNTVSLLGGVVTYDAKIEADNCTADANANVTCRDTTTVRNLRFAAQHILGSFTSPVTYSASSVSVQLPGYCTGVAIFNGTLTLNASSQQTSGGMTTVEMAPIELIGTLTCLGLPSASLKVALEDLGLSSTHFQGGIPVGVSFLTSFKAL